MEKQASETERSKYRMSDDEFSGKNTYNEVRLCRLSEMNLPVPILHSIYECSLIWRQTSIVKNSSRKTILCAFLRLKRKKISAKELRNNSGKYLCTK